MPPRRQRWAQPVAGPPQSHNTYRVFEPTGGLDRTRLPQHLPPSAAVDLDNFVIVDNRLRLRSRLSRLGTTATPYDSWLLAGRIRTQSNAEHVLLASRGSLQRSVDAGAWAHIGTLTSSTTTGFYFTTEVYNSDNTLRYIGVNGQHSGFIYNPVAGSVTTLSLVSTAPIQKPWFACAADERLVLLSAQSAERVIMWSVRGSPLSFGDADGDAGFQQLTGLNGTPTGLVRDGENLLIFTTSGIYIGAPRRDVFAFDFTPSVLPAPGTPYSRAIVPTPVGVVYLGGDLKIYAVAQGQPRLVSDSVEPMLRDELVGSAYDVFAVYDAQAHAYVLFYPATSGVARKALIVSLKRGIGITTMSAPASSASWQAATALQVPSAITSQHQLGIAAQDGQFYRMPSAATGDAGVYTPEATYTMPAIADPADGHLMPTEVMFDYYSRASNSRITFEYSGDGFQTYAVAASRRLSSTTKNTLATVVLPVSLSAQRYPQFRVRMSADNDSVALARIRIGLRRYAGTRVENLEPPEFEEES